MMNALSSLRAVSVALLALSLDGTNAFVSGPQNGAVRATRQAWLVSTQHTTSVNNGSTTSLSMIDTLSSASMYLSTVSADIDSIPTDNFGLVFAGGIAVMVGGVLSAIIVGAILESGDNYANVMADSYAQGGDEAFWESLSADDKEKTKELLKKVKESKNKGKPMRVEANEETTEGASTEKKKVEVDMFSDYE